MSDFLLYFAATNLMVAAAVVVVMILRLPARRLFGARIAYGLWSLAPLTGLAMLLPSRVVTVPAPVAAEPALPLQAVAPAAVQAASALDPGLAILWLWILGGLASFAWLGWRQHQFGRAVRAGRAGPAVIGVLKPRIVMPDDFAGLYTPREQEVVLAHERAHIERNDARVNALVALSRCAAWFNPLVHVLAHYLRIDQELACDAHVVAAYPQARRSYAQAMLKTQLAARPLPLGCYWPAQSAHPLAERIRLLTHGTPGRLRRTAGHAVVALLALTGAGAAWAAKPAHVILAPAPALAPAIRLEAAPPPAVSHTKTAPAPKPHTIIAATPAAPEPNPPAVELAANTEPQLDAPPPPSASAWTWAGARARPNLRPMISPGSAVRVVAATLDPDGVPLSNDITSYGSNPRYRSGSYQRAGSRYGLYTNVFQHGDRYWVAASVTQNRQPVAAGGVSLAPGQTGDIHLANGQVVTVTATARPETPEETAIARAADHGAVVAEARSAQARYDQTRERVRRLRGEPVY